MAAAMRRRNGRQGGFLLAEALVTIGVLGMLLTTFWMSISLCSKLNRYLLARQQCIAAAQAQLDAVAATGEVLGEEKMEKLWPNVRVTIEKEAGTGQWEGLMRFRAIAETVRGKSQCVTLVRYVRAEAESR